MQSSNTSVGLLSFFILNYHINAVPLSLFHRRHPHPRNNHPYVSVPLADRTLA